MYNDYETIYETKIIDYFWIYFWIILALIIIFLTLFGLSHIFKKASIKKIYAYIPFLNLFKTLEICGLSKIHLILIFLPIINIYSLFKINIELSECFNKKKSYSILLTLFPFIYYPILGITNEKYVGINNKKVKTIVIEELKKEVVEVDTPSEIVKKDTNISLGTNDVKPKLEEINAKDVQENTPELIIETNEVKEPNNELVIDTNILNKPEKDDNEFVECPNCHKKVKKISDRCFWCGAKLEQ